MPVKAFNDLLLFIEFSSYQSVESKILDAYFPGETSQDQTTADRASVIIYPHLNF